MLRRLVDVVVKPRDQIEFFGVGDLAERLGLDRGEFLLVIPPWLQRGGARDVRGLGGRSLRGRRTTARHTSNEQSPEQHAPQQKCDMITHRLTILPSRDDLASHRERANRLRSIGALYMRRHPSRLASDRPRSTNWN